MVPKPDEGLWDDFIEKRCKRGDTRDVIIQCPTCRALTSILGVKPVASGDAVAIECRECGGLSLLPIVGASTEEAMVLPGPTSLVVASSPTESAVEPESSSRVDVDLKNQTQSREESEGKGAIHQAIVDVGTPAEHEVAVVDDLLALVPSWDDVDAHIALVRQAAVVDRLSPLGVRYRAVMAACPDDESAKAAQQEILSQALVRMQMAPGGAKAEIERGQFVGKIAMAVVALLMGGAIWFMVISMRSL